MLAATRWNAPSPYAHQYVELAPKGATFCTDLIRNAAEPATLVRELPAELPSIVKFVIFTDPNDSEWAPMSEAAIERLRSNPQGRLCRLLHAGLERLKDLNRGCEDATLHPWPAGVDGLICSFEERS